MLTKLNEDDRKLCSYIISKFNAGSGDYDSLHVTLAELCIELLDEKEASL